MSDYANSVQRLLTAILEFIYKNYQEYINEAFEYFWEEERPEEFLQGLLLDIGELNFEDWLAIDYRTPYGESFLDLYREYSNLSEEDTALVNALKESRISIYEVEMAEEDGVVIKDLLAEGRYKIKSSSLSSLKPGEIFATRLIKFNNDIIMGRCVYPFKASLKEEVLRYIEMQFKRYLKNENPSGNMESFLKDASSLFNTIWVTTIIQKG